MGIQIVVGDTGIEVSGQKNRRASPQKPKKPGNDEFDFWAFHVEQQLYIGLANYGIALLPLSIANFIKTGLDWTTLSNILYSNELLYASIVVGVLYFIDFISNTIKIDSKRYYAIYNFIWLSYGGFAALGVVINIMYILKDDIITIFPFIFEYKSHIIPIYGLLPFVFLVLQSLLNYWASLKIGKEN